ncbi:MAG: alpha-N-arabinofuranosidase [Lachnospiraceae bacterium]|nr:alpha-N-arabinofuranosidase [Lachnospiraceae bacterium]
MLKSHIICNEKYVTGEIDSRLYGSFLEHMGRVIYHGVYEPGHTSADEEGFRRDVLQAVRDMGVTAVRYPGGNFVSAYHWEDGVGPRGQRPRKIDLAWKAIETNAFGTDEFIHWARKAQVQPIFTVNLGTRGMEEALQYLEYCNFPSGTMYSDLRRSHGIEDPYGVRIWCLGNEMDGSWQVGHKSAVEYGRLAAETGKTMKLLDSNIELIACGSSLSTMDTCPAWDLEVLEQTYDVIDYLALHQYYGGQEMGTAAFLAQTLDMEEYIRTIRAAVQVIRQKKRSVRNVRLSIDEWGVWAVPGNTVNREVEENLWQTAAPISEQIYTMEDALLFAGMQMTMLRNADVVKIACQSLLTNVSACIMTDANGEMWLQTIYYPFYYFANYARGVVMQSKCQCEAYGCGGFDKVPYLDQLVVWNTGRKEVAIFLINRSEADSQEVETELQGMTPVSVTEAVYLSAKNKKMTNHKDHSAVKPERYDEVKIQGNCVTAELMPLTFMMIRLAIQK